MLRRNGPVVKSVESVLRLERSLWWERFVTDLHAKFALRPHHLWKYGRHPICDG